MAAAPLLCQRLVRFDLDRLGLAPGIVLLGHYRNTNAATMLGEHRHQGIVELCYLARGRQVYRVGGRDYAMSAGDLFLTFPDEPHSSGGQPQEKGELYWMQLRADLADLLNLPSGMAKALVAELHKLPTRHFVASKEVRELFARSFERAAEYADAEPNDMMRLEMGALIGQLLVEVRRCAMKWRPQSEQPSDMNRAIRYIQTNIGRGITLNELASATGLSESWFKARFRQAMGIPPREYVLREKIARATQMLGAGESVTDVAMKLGFSSSQYFATVFKRFTGYRPSESRGDLS